MIKHNGLTLIELLVVMAVLSVTGIYILNIFTSSLRGSNKSQEIGIIKQNGQAVLNVMDRTVRNADNVVCPFFLQPTDTTSYSNTLVTVKDGVYTRYRLIPTTNIINNSPGNNCGTTIGTGCFVQDNPVRGLNSDGTKQSDPQFVDSICHDATQSPMLPTAILLTDSNPQTGISVSCINNDTTCTQVNTPAFLRQRASGYKDQVAIRFLAKPGVNAPNAVSGQIDPVPFQTTINLR